MQEIALTLEEVHFERPPETVHFMLGEKGEQPGIVDGVAVRADALNLSLRSAVESVDSAGQGPLFWKNS